jgi:hypothetical protein
MSLSDTLLNYLNEVQSKVSSEQYAPHPMIKALMLALRSAQTGGTDGNFAVASGDADLTPDKQPQLVFIVAVGEKGDQIKVLEIREANTGKVVTSAMAEKIIHSEILIEKYNEVDIPNKQAEAILTDSLGFPVHILGDKSEIDQSLKNAQDELSRNRVPNVPRQIREEILGHKDASNWRELFQQSRSSNRVSLGSKVALETRHHKFGVVRSKVETSRMDISLCRL